MKNQFHQYFQLRYAEKIIVLFFLLLHLIFSSYAQTTYPNAYWNNKLTITSWRLPPAPAVYKPVYIDIDKDGDIDIIQTITRDSIPVMWIDDDDDMKKSDTEGDTDSDCLLIDKNRDGFYGGMGDLIIDWIDTDKDQHADIEIMADYPQKNNIAIWPYGHYMIVLDTDKDNVFNYIDWNTFSLQSWAHNGTDDFFADYNGQSAFMKVHAATNRIDDLKLNWENPFLFYDPDNDGRTEIALRLVDQPKYVEQDSSGYQKMYLRKNINWASLAVDMDNDNSAEYVFDFDFTINFRGTGFDYDDQQHIINNQIQRGTDHFFMDPRLRHINKLLYTDHKKAPEMVFNKGKWDKVYFVYDEDDDCHRWERVELLDPLDPFIIGARKGGIDNNTQSDPTGDRGEWDMDNSGKGKLYISRFDGRLHLYGADWGVWRIDQEASYYQGYDRLTIKKEPETFATVKYNDNNKNGFIDEISYDLDGDHVFETIISLDSLGFSDQCETIDISKFTYKDYTSLQEKIATQMWQHAKEALAVAKTANLNISWYARYLKPASVRQQYHYGYWLQFYIYKDLEHLYRQQNNLLLLKKVTKAYYTANWKSFF
ncbi:MAG: hypothetical protein ACK5NK_05680 [Niabella sp.]